MSSPWVRRLENEYETMRQLRERTSLICFACEGTPPTTYHVKLHCSGLCRLGNLVVPIGEHEFDLILLPDFPVVAPKIVWKTPIFHPNFLGPDVCLGDHWYPAWCIADMCVAVCEMVQYKTFNVYDPLDRMCAAWLAHELERQPERFPVDDRPALDLDFEIAKPSPIERED